MPDDLHTRAVPAHVAPGLDYSAFRAAAPALAMGLVGLILLFLRESVAAVEVWDASTAYNHCFLVIPIALWMAWERRASFANIPMRPALWAIPAALPLAVAWFLADRVGIMEGRQLAAMGLIQLLFFVVLGVDLWKKLSAPLLYLIFLVPFGAFLVPVLQDITAAFVVRGLNILGILHYTDGYIIELSIGTFFVAEACAGLRFLVASIAFGALYACTIYRSPVRRAVFIAMSIVVPIIANGFRALGIVVAGQYLGSAEAAAADHVIYGWGFFSFVTLLLILIGLPFREDRDPLPHGQASSRYNAPPRKGLFAVATLLGLAVLGPGISAALDRGTMPRVASQDIAQWIAQGGGLAADCRPTTNIPNTAVAATQQRFECADGAVTMTVALFAPRANPGLVVQGQRRLSGDGGESDVSPLTVGTAAASMRWRLVETREPHGARATGLWIDGAPTGLSLATRMRLARNSIMGATHAPVLVVLTPTVDWARLGAAGRTPARQILARFLTAHPDLPAGIATLSTDAGR